MQAELRKMYKIVTISAFPPLNDNHNAPNSLIHNILYHRPENIEVYLYFYEQEEISPQLESKCIKSLDVAHYKKLRLTNQTNKNKIKSKLNFHVSKFLRIPLPQIINNYSPDKSVLEEIKQIKPDLIWLYPYWLFKWKELCYSFNTVVSGMDSAALHYLRALENCVWHDRNEANILIRSYRESFNLEYEWGNLPVTMHMVGKADLDYYFNINKKKSKGFFSLHPHNKYKPASPDFNINNKIKVLITGNAKSIYFGNNIDEIIELLSQNSNLSKYYSFTFIGANFEEYTKHLIKYNYEAYNLTWVDDFSSTISEYDIQVFPIIVGTGTKNKVLHAMATGLLGIGTRLAFENIQIEPTQDCVIYETASGLIEIFQDLMANKTKYAEIAKRGTIAVRKHHNPKSTSELFWKNSLKKTL